MGKADIVRFRQFRAYEEARRSANDAMMGLLAGAGIAAHALQPTEGSGERLEDVFPDVPHIGRLDITSEKARAIIYSADTHLGAMSVPYTIALHEDFMGQCLKMAADFGLCSRTKVRKVALSEQHDLLAQACKSTFDPDELARLNLLRLMRNLFIHAGGVVDEGLVKHINERWSPSIERRWMKITKSSPTTLQIGDKLIFRHNEMVLALAITKELSRQANIMLSKAASRETWADIAIADLVADHPNILRAEQFAVKAAGFCGWNYRALQLTPQEIEAARQRAL